MKRTALLLETYSEHFKTTPIHYIKEKSLCSCGMRSISKRCDEILAAVKILNSINECYKCCDYEKMKKICNCSEMPQCIKNATAREYYEERIQIFEETSVQNFGLIIKKFCKIANENDTNVCDLCNMLNTKSEMAQVSHSRLLDYGIKNIQKCINLLIL